MENTQRDWDELGKNIRDIVDQAVNRQDYQKLNDTIRQTVGRAVDLGGEAIRKAADAISRAEAPGAGQQPAEVKDTLISEIGNLKLSELRNL